MLFIPFVLRESRDQFVGDNMVGALEATILDVEKKLFNGETILVSITHAKRDRRRATAKRSRQLSILNLPPLSYNRQILK